MDSYTLSDLAAVTRNNNVDDFGGMGGGWIVWILLFALLGGGGFGWGNNRGNCATAEDLASGFNFNSLQSKTNDILAAVNNNNQVLGNAICQLGYQDLQNFNVLERQIADCCCQNQLATQSVKFDMANYANAIQMGQMQGTHQVLDKLCAVERALSDAQKDAQIAAQGQKINQLENDLRFCRLPVISNVGWTVNPVQGCTPCGNGYAY